VVDAGAGPGVLLLHGFPDSGYVWRNQVGALVDAGFRVIAPDLRGFGKSDKPEGVKAYAMGELLKDVRGILRALGLPRVHVVGQDWGAVLTWMLAVTKPDRVDHLVAISVGHPGNFAPRSLRQMQLSWYILLFQFPGLAEELIPRDDWRFLKGWARGTGDLDRWPKDVGRPGALTAALNWYRANDDPMRLLEPAPTFPWVASRVLGVFGAPRRGPDRGIDDGLGEVHQRSLALRALRRRRALGPAGTAGAAQRDAGAVLRARRRRCQDRCPGGAGEA